MFERCVFAPPLSLSTLLRVSGLLVPLRKLSLRSALAEFDSVREVDGDVFPEPVMLVMTPPDIALGTLSLGKR
ncbi:hypothetical protein LMG27198_20170 [Methylocystis echinoides]|uniref:Uncharacterized protein n=1 Tax=Methylocystis echinoides TaxID=29468 RepID=A0A9W6GU92_9HYPH|nr:hypothetical protein LMG27198_20170 [Methylocystis echinoides]